MSRKDDIRAWDAIWEQSRIGPAYERAKKAEREKLVHTVALLREKRHAARLAGLCAICDEPPFRAGLCFRHFVGHRLRVAGLLPKGRLKRRDVLRCRKFVRFVWMRFTLVGRDPRAMLSEEQALLESFRIRQAWRISWGGANGVKKMAKIILYFERIAKEEHNANL